VPPGNGHAHPVDKAGRGDIILLHASDSAKQTSNAVPILIDKLQKKGYHFETVSEIMASTDTKAEEIN
jgi:peptidoglycan-N-acetylglucosamine deacetylase